MGNERSPLVELNLQIATEQSDIGNVEQWQAWFGEWLAVLADVLPEAAAFELSLRLCGDRDIAALNGQYRGDPVPTDVLSFATRDDEIPALPPEARAEPLYLGDVVISTETAARQAARRHHSLTLELAWLAAHGLLHLLGWEHRDRASLREMLHRQGELLRRSRHLSETDDIPLLPEELSEYTELASPAPSEP